MSEITERACSGCGQTKPLEDFYKFKSGPYGRTTRCKLCMGASQKKYSRTEDGRAVKSRAYKKWRDANLELARELSRESNKVARAEDPERFRDYDRKRHYGLEYGKYAVMLAAQGGGCAICASPEPGGNGVFHVDHCHVSKKVRGLLCSNCNTGLGKFKDDRQRLLAAARYLEGLPEVGRERASAFNSHEKKLI